MSYPIHEKFVIGVASSALFDLSESHKVFVEEGPERYKIFQEAHIDRVLAPGAAFPFIKRFLSINKRFPVESPVEVVLLSRNSPETGLRVFRSIAAHELDISRAAFMTGRSPYKYLSAFNASLFLTGNEGDAKQAIDAGHPAGLVLPSQDAGGPGVDDDADPELRVAFDFDGVIADDEAETVFKSNDLDAFLEHEIQRAAIPHNHGPLAELFRKLAALREFENKAAAHDSDYRRIVRTAIVTARNAPAHERVVTTLKSWGVSADETFFLGGMPKDRILSVLKPHMFFDDQKLHLEQSGSDVPMVHVPFGIANRLPNLAPSKNMKLSDDTLPVAEN